MYNSVCVDLNGYKKTGHVDMCAEEGFVNCLLKVGIESAKQWGVPFNRRSPWPART